MDVKTEWGLCGVHKNYGDKKILEDYHLSLKLGAVTSLLGPSGAGKTTILNLLAGLTSPDVGTVIFPEGATVSYVFQEPRLLPWLTVMGNLKFALKDTGHSDLEDIERVLRGVELWDDRHRWPHQLSGGMRQRVSLARGLGRPSDLLLLDEPFKGLDTALKERVITFCLSRWEMAKPTVLVVTHDRWEAEALGSAIIEMRESTE